MMSSNHARLDGVAVRYATRADSGPILNLVNLIQPEIPWTPEHLQWQFFGSPGGPPRVYVIEDSAGEVVSLYAAVAQRLQCGEKVVTARMVQDAMTHPDYRGRGFMQHLGQLCREDMEEPGEVGYTFPKVKSTSANNFRRNGWHELCEVPLRRKGLAGTGQDRGDVLIRPLPRGEFFDCRATEAWEQSGLSIGVRRDDAFLNWRYAKPGIAYMRFWIGDASGFLVLKSYFQDGRRTVHLCDLVVKQAQGSLVPRVLRQCESLAFGLGAEEVTAWLAAEHRYAADFDAQGWIVEPKGTHSIFVLPRKDASADFFNPASWHVSQGDSDVY